MSSHLDYEINKELGECYLFMGELDKAESYYEKAAGSNGVHPDPYLGLATIAVQRGDLGRALSLYQKANDIVPTDKSLAGMGLINAQQGDHSSAFTFFTQALDVNPENMIALFGLVQAAHVLGRTADAIVPLGRYLDLNPTKSEVRYALGGCLSSCGRVEEAKKQLAHTLELDPDYAPATELLSQL
ncbi:MAG: tetratricopeptide repeat protein [Desulfomicrobium sp.]|jgi:tetratricopeptide (TPR) repeat protein|nr:tetratricopeptide repeat protein [Desulfomicrobium sp.]NLV96813.1 tetratricopeptide repeat protein [Desulfovibrionales bacterium]